MTDRKNFDVISNKSRLHCTILVTTALLVGCATNPNDLKTPSQISCIDVPEPMSFSGRYGLFGMVWTTRLERGPYWSEKVDAKGTYFRAPPGGIVTKGEGGARFLDADGGFYVPNAPGEPITIYRYSTTINVPAEIPPAEATCATGVYMKDPTSSGVNLVGFAAGGAIGGAAGGTIARSMAGGTKVSYGRAAGAGAAGGLIGGLIVGSIIEADVGKIVPGMPIQDDKFLQALRSLHASRVLLREAATKGESTQPLQTP